MKMLLLVLLLLWNDKEGAHATQGKQTHCVDVRSFQTAVVADCNRRNERGGVFILKKKTKTKCMKEMYDQYILVKQIIRS